MQAASLPPPDRADDPHQSEDDGGRNIAGM
jgi:hypothetical protein